MGASGYAVNLLVFAACVHGMDLHYRAAATLAFLVAVASNFWWNRHWTFDAPHRAMGFQAARFFAVSIAAFGLSLLILTVLVQDAGVPKLAAQAVAVACATPVSFLGNKLWSFAR